MKTLAIWKLLLISSVFNCLALAMPTPAVAESVTVISQNDVFLGRSTLYLGKESAKFLARGDNFMILCGPPTWKVMIYRKEDNRAMVFDLTDWDQDGFKLMPPKTELRRALVTPVFFQPANQTCKQFVLSTNKRFFESNDPLVFRSETSKTLSKITCITTSGIKLGDKMTKFIHGLYSQPWTNEIPLSLTNTLSDGSEAMTYKLISMKQANVAPDFFAYPKNYTLVTNRKDIMTSKKEEKRAHELLDSLIDEYKETTPKPR
ncbi:MAG: hypothetical protein JSS83_11005 [Cyanobacteria bacterium SZAS LIN-3]|nr:hypothetical protein [Cyanobacteria bacterium SZAS LIN-3]MBS2006008.1 hypothetical protein [Cyanobacteria bacterium SZAS TMP-1]